MEASEAAATGPAALQGACSEGSKVRNLDFNDVIDIFAKSKARKAVFWTVDLCLCLLNILDKF